MATIVKITETTNGKDLVRFAHSTSKTIAGKLFESTIVYYMFCVKGEFTIDEEFPEFEELLSVCDVVEREYTHDSGETTKTKWLTLAV